MCDRWVWNSFIFLLVRATLPHDVLVLKHAAFPKHAGICCPTGVWVLHQGAEDTSISSA